MSRAKAPKAAPEAPVDQIADYHDTHPTLGRRPSDLEPDKAPDTGKADTDAPESTQDPEGD